MKKKFDEIFSATKYTKALEHIGRLRKEQAAAIKEHKLRVENLRLQKDHASKLKDRHDDARDKATALGSRMKELQVRFAGMRLKGFSRSSQNRGGHLTPLPALPRASQTFLNISQFFTRGR